MTPLWCPLPRHYLLSAYYGAPLFNARTAAVADIEGAQQLWGHRVWGGARRQPRGRANPATRAALAAISIGKEAQRREQGRRSGGND